MRTQRIFQNLSRLLLALLALGVALCGSACSNVRTWMGMQHSDSYKPISNPFSAYQDSRLDPSQQPMILRSTKGDRSVEVQIPADPSQRGDIAIPMSPGFKNLPKESQEYLENGDTDSDSADYPYKNHSPTLSDRQIANTQAPISLEDEGRAREIERDLYLKTSDDSMATDKTTSYLARVDHIKQLYHRTRFEAALLESDELLREYPYDSKIYEMRGTLLDRLGRRDLAVKAWNQALRLDSKNEGLRKFVIRKQMTQSSRPSADDHSTNGDNP